MKKNKGITIVALVITIILLLILAGVSINVGTGIIEESKLETIKTNMLLIEGKAKGFVEQASFKLGTNIDTVSQEEKENRITAAKEELKGTEISSENINIFPESIEMTAEKINGDNANYIYYYKLSTQDLADMGLNNVKSDENKGWYIIKYDLINISVETYNTKGFEVENGTYYSSNEIGNLEI